MTPVTFQLRNNFYKAMNLTLNNMNVHNFVKMNQNSRDNMQSSGSLGKLAGKVEIASDIFVACRCRTLCGSFKKLISI